MCVLWLPELSAKHQQIVLHNNSEHLYHNRLHCPLVQLKRQLLAKHQQVGQPFMQVNNSNNKILDLASVTVHLIMQ